MISTDLLTRWHALIKLEMIQLMHERKPWKRHNRTAIREAFARCREDAEHNAAVALRCTVAELRKLSEWMSAGSDVEVGKVDLAKGAAPADAHAGE